MAVSIEGGYMVVQGQFDPRLPYSVCPDLTCDWVNGDIAQVRVPWTYDNAYALANIGIECVSPMPRDYSFPMFQKTPMVHQIQGADFLARNRRAYMLSGAGSGKTLTASWAADYLLLTGKVRKVLVVVYKPTLYSAWAEDIETHLPHMSFTVLTDDNAEKRLKKMKSDAPVHIINHDGPAHFWPELAENNYDLIIYDESTAIKRVSTDRWRGLDALVRPNPRLRLWLMTATPTAHSPMDAYGQIRMIGNINREAQRCPPGEIWGGAFMTEEQWKKATMVSENVGNRTIWKAAPWANEVVMNYMRPAFCRRTEDCVDLPPTVTLPRADLKPTAAQKKAWTTLRKGERHEGDDGQTISIKAPVALLSKVIQIACGCVYADTPENPIIAGIDEGSERPVMEFDVREKNEEMLRLIDEVDGKAIVYVPFTAVVHRVAAYLERAGKRVVKIYGSMSPQAVRDAINGDFQTDGPNSAEVIVAIPQKMSHGITATAANLIVWYAPILRGEPYQQANFRIKRIGQHRTMFYAQLACCATERERYDQLGEGSNNQQDLLRLYSSFMSGVV
ncbi:uncharacterized protein [Drosophila takahashii]|uniref:uncharacterized protein n=1 Tax=Drosophila takahashii TaxID=29030 RepID=UPI00389926DA